MKQIGRKIFYDKTTGNVIQDIGERQGSVIETTNDQDIETYTILSERNRDTFDVIELPFGANAQDFAECIGCRVNLETKELEFSYPDPNEPESEPVYQAPLTVKVSTLVQENTEIKGRLASTEEVLMTILFPPEV